VDAAKKHRADMVALSALLTPTMPQMEATVGAVREAELSLKNHDRGSAGDPAIC